MKSSAAICLLAIAISCLLAYALHMKGSDEKAVFAAMIGAAASIAIISAGYRSQRSIDTRLALSSSPVSSWAFSVEGDARQSMGTWRARARAQRAGAASASVWLYSPERLYAGMVVKGIGTFKDLGDNDWAQASRAQGVCAGIQLAKIMSIEEQQGPLQAVRGMRRRLLDALRPEADQGRALVAACVLGDRTGLDSYGADDYLRRCGLSHLVAVSGTHLAIVSAFVAKALGDDRLGPKSKALLLIAATGLFVLLAGVPPSAVRAWVMLACSQLSVFAGRSSHSISSLCAAALGMALIDPAMTGQLAYQLSVAAVYGICVVYPYLRYASHELLFPQRLARMRFARSAKPLIDALRSAIDLFALSITAQLVTFPISSSTFDEVSVIGPLTNLFAAPLIALVTFAGLLACMLVPVWGAHLALLEAIKVPASLTLESAKALSGFWWAAIPVGNAARFAGHCLFVCSLLLAWYSPKVNRKAVGTAFGVAALCASLFFVKARYFAPPRIIVLDVGQGDAILIQDGAHALLVDAGLEGALGDALMRNAVFHIDAVVVSHLHNDHYGGLADLAGRMGCERVFVAKGCATHVPDDMAQSMSSLRCAHAEELSQFDEISVGRFTFRMLAPGKEVDGLENEDSMFLFAAFEDGEKGLSVLFTGDGEQHELAYALSVLGNEIIDVLKVGHHGSSESITKGQAQAISPIISVISAGRQNEFGHPHKSTVSALEETGSVVVCTKDFGDIEVKPGLGEVRVDHARPWSVLALGLSYNRCAVPAI